MKFKWVKLRDVEWLADLGLVELRVLKTDRGYVGFLRGSRAFRRQPTNTLKEAIAGLERSFIKRIDVLLNENYAEKYKPAADSQLTCKKVLSVLRLYPNGLTSVQIAKKCDRPVNQVSALLSHCEKQGRVEKRSLVARSAPETGKGRKARFLFIAV